MMIKPITKDILFLSAPSSEATENDKEIAKDLYDTLNANGTNCYGMAANMIGERKRIIAFYEGPFIVIMYNPVITKREEEYEIEETCLSLVGARNCKRHKTIEVEYFDKYFEKKKKVYHGLTAEVIEHECDHLEGIII